MVGVRRLKKWSGKPYMEVRISQCGYWSKMAHYSGWAKRDHTTYCFFKTSAEVRERVSKVRLDDASFFVGNSAGLAGDCWQNSGLILVCQCLQWVERWRWHLRLKSAIFVSCDGKYLMGANSSSRKVHVDCRELNYKEPNSKITIGIVCTSKQCREKPLATHSTTTQIEHAKSIMRSMLFVMR